MDLPKNVIISNNFANYAGGGMYCRDSNAQLTNVVFSGNSVNNDGGGMWNYSGDPVLTDVVFIGNSAVRDCGGMFNAYYSNPTLTNVSFVENSGRNGGGLYNSGGIPTLVNVTFWENSATSTGGGMFNIGGSDPILINASFSGNTAGSRGGGMRNNSGCDPAMTNVIMWGDSAGTNDEIDNFGTPVISYSLIAGCGGSGGGWNASFGTDNGHNIEGNPMFKGTDFPNSPLAIYSSSPAVNAGDNSAIPPGVTTDFAGNPRIYGTNVDMGAYEHQGSPTGIDNGPEDVLPSLTAIRSAYPNPFNPSVTLVFDLDSSQDVLLAIYDVQGKLVKRLVKGFQTAGTHEVRWDGTDGIGNTKPSGVYFVSLKWEGRSDHRKIVLMK
jgi:hypothetical protein